MKRASSSPSILIVVTTVGTQEQALDIAHALVHERLAACVNIVPGIRSIFRWQGKIHDEGEFLLLIKTTADKFEAVKKKIRAIHTYELPEILGFPAPVFEERFAAWIGESSHAVKRSPRAPAKKVARTKG